MAGLVPAIPSIGHGVCVPKRDARDKPAHDAEYGYGRYPAHSLVNSVATTCS